MKKTAEEILISEYLEEVKDIPVSGLPLFSANDCRILMSRFAEFSSQDKWVSVEEKPLEKGIRISPIFIISEEKGQKYYAESDWDGERFIHPYYGQEMTGIHENVTHYLLPSPPKTK